MNESPKFEVQKAELNFHCEWGVWPTHSDASICYTTTEKHSKLIAAALNHFLAADEGREFLERLDRAIQLS